MLVSLGRVNVHWKDQTGAGLAFTLHSSWLKVTELII